MAKKTLTEIYGGSSVYNAMKAYEEGDYNSSIELLSRIPQPTRRSHLAKQRLHDEITAEMNASAYPELVFRPPIVPYTVVQIGKVATVRAPAAGGLAPYTYKWTASNGKVITSTSHLALYSTNAQVEESRAVVTCEVTDARGVKLIGSSIVVIEEEFMLDEQMASELFVNVGDTIQLSNTAMGGLAPYTYTWGTYNDMQEDIRFGSTTSTCDVQITSELIGREIYCDIRDTAGQLVTAVASIIEISQK